MSLKRLCDHGKLDEVFHILKHSKDITFTEITDVFYSLLQDCIQTRNLTAGRRIYCQIVRHNLEHVSYVGSQLIRMFAACRNLQDANQIFDRLPNPNLFAWNEIILAHTALRCAEKAFNLYYRMQLSSVRPDAHIHVAILKACASTQALAQGKLIHCDVVELHPEAGFYVWGALIDMYSKCGSMQDAQSIFDNLRRRNVVIWSAMIAGYVKCDRGEEALRLYNKMLLEGFDPDLVTIVSILKACSGAGALREGKMVHAQIVDCGFVMDATLGNSLLNMYARCAAHAEAHIVFNMLRKRDVVTWSSMVDSYAEHRDHALALGFFEIMLKEGVKPDEVALLCLLSACSQLGLVGNGCYHFNMLAGTFGILPRLEHFNCMVDLLGRAGCLIEANDLLKIMPYQENEVGWRCLRSHRKLYSDSGDPWHTDVEDSLTCKSVCSNHINARLGIAASKTEGKGQTSALGVLSDTATITAQTFAHTFSVADAYQLQSFGLQDKLFRLTTQIKEWGYAPSFESVFESVFEKQEEDDLLYCRLHEDLLGIVTTQHKHDNSSKSS